MWGEGRAARSLASDVPAPRWCSLRLPVPRRALWRGWCHFSLGSYTPSRCSARHGCLRAVEGIEPSPPDSRPALLPASLTAVLDRPGVSGHPQLTCRFPCPGGGPVPIFPVTSLPPVLISSRNGMVLSGAIRPCGLTLTRRCSEELPPPGGSASAVVPCSEGSPAFNRLTPSPERLPNAPDWLSPRFHFPRSCCSLLYMSYARAQPLGWTN